MAEHDKLIKVLNQAVSLEYTAVIQYNQHSMLVTGPDKAIFEDFFRDSSKEALSHAKMWGEKIVYLGGVPTVEVGTIHQSTELTEMLEMDHELEKQVLEIYLKAHEICTHVPTQYLLEDHIMAEQNDVEELAKFLRRVNIAGGKLKVEKKVG
ncbi:MAG: ferritin-like domain-containing protein [Acidobacteriota bacterium]